MQALQVIRKTLRQIVNEYPIFYSAVKLLAPTEYPEIWRDNDLDAVKHQKISTDGVHLWYTPEHVEMMETIMSGPGLREEILHVILHCLFGHLEESPEYRNKQILWAAMDRQVWHVMLGLDRRYTGYENTPAIVQLNMNSYLGNCFDVGCYYKAKSNPVIRKQMLRDAKGLVSDDHRLWNPKILCLEIAVGACEGVSSEQQEMRKRAREAWRALRASLIGDGPAEEGLLRAMQRESEMEKNYGSGSGEDYLEVTIKPENQNTYAHILRRFLTMKEDQREVPDAIDPMLYQYGLDLYGDVPLIEPPDSEEQLKLNTICVAVDTSDSCEEEAGYFLRETQNILTDLSRMAPRCEFYFFQCDDGLQKEEHYTCVEDIPWKEMENMRMYGWGGTSFVPVFDRIRELEDEAEKTIDCLIYFSDALGVFPDTKPGYPTFFVLPQEYDEDECDLIPEWVEVLRLREE